MVTYSGAYDIGAESELSAAESKARGSSCLRDFLFDPPTSRVQPAMARPRHTRHNDMNERGLMCATDGA